MTAIATNPACFRKLELPTDIGQPCLTKEQKVQRLTYEGHLVRSGQPLEKNQMPLLFETLDTICELAKTAVAVNADSQEINLDIQEVFYKVRICKSANDSHDAYVYLAFTCPSLVLGNGGIKPVQLGIKIPSLCGDYQPVAITEILPLSITWMSSEELEENLLSECSTGNELITTFGIDGICPFTQLARLSIEEHRLSLVAPLCLGSYEELNLGIIYLDTALKLQNASIFFKTLKAVHEAGFVHGDLKPANLFIDLSGRAKIGDWGSSQKRSDFAQESTFASQCRSDKRSLSGSVFTSFTKQDDAEEAFFKLTAIYQNFNMTIGYSGFREQVRKITN